MKKIIYLFSILSITLAAVSCSSDDDAPIVVPPVVATCTDGIQNQGEAGIDCGGPCAACTVEPVDEIVELPSNLTTTTLTADKKYLVKGQVFIPSGVVVTVEPGTVIFGDKATRGTLIVAVGGKLEAEGTAAAPIVMTSALPAGARDRGDWGGLVILGAANVNQPEPAIEGITPAVIYGGTNDADNSGTYKYLRVEFAGIELTPNNETNSITMGAVGSGTVMEYNQVSWGGDDGFEWFGGSVDGKYFISFASWDDSFDVDFGYTGKVQYGLEVRYPSYADQSGSNAFECDNGPNDNVTDLLTTGTFSNFTCIGPRLTSGQSINANYQHSLDLRRRTAVTIANSVFVGYPRGIRMNQQSVVDNYTAGTGVFTNNVMVAPAMTYSLGSGVTGDLEALWTATNEMIVDTDFEAVYAGLGLNPNIFFGNNVSIAYSANPTFTVTTGSLTSGADFTNPKLAGFEVTTYIGGFGDTDWTAGWAEFNPITKVYE